MKKKRSKKLDLVIVLNWLLMLIFIIIAIAKIALGKYVSALVLIFIAFFLMPHSPLSSKIKLKEEFKLIIVIFILVLITAPDYNPEIENIVESDNILILDAYDSAEESNHVGPSPIVNEIKIEK